MSGALYRYDVRILACQGCGAPLSVPVRGGLATCSYCGASHEVAARDDRDRAAASRAHEHGLSESARIARLREQEGREEALPDSVRALLVDGRIVAEQAEAVLSVWRSTRRRLAEAPDDFPSAERLFHLTRLMLPYTERESRRALLETALELLPDARHRHVLRCELAMSAAREGELEAADAWLELVERRPLDLLMDSAVRAAMATIEIARGRASRALSQVAERVGDVPVTPSYAIAIELLRVHALEALGRDAEADGCLSRLTDEIGWDRVHEGAEAQRPLLIAPWTRLRVRRARAEQRLVDLERSGANLLPEARSALNASIGRGLVLVGLLVVLAHVLQRGSAYDGVATLVAVIAFFAFGWLLEGLVRVSECRKARRRVYEELRAARADLARLRELADEWAGGDQRFPLAPTPFRGGRDETVRVQADRARS